MSSLGSLSLARRAAACALAAAALLAVPAASATAAPQWYGGTGAYQTGLSCVGGYNSYTNQTQAFVSYWADPAANYPALGDLYWMRVHVGMIGYTCPYGIGDVAIKLSLPDGTSLAVDPSSSNPDHRVRCYGTSASGATSELTNVAWTAPWDTSIRGKYCDSTVTPSSTGSGYDLGLRLLAQGQQMWINVPVRSTKRLAGMAGAGDTTKAVATLTSGVNTTSSPYQWVTVFDRPTTVSYPAQATTSIGDTSAKTTGVLTSWWRKGKAYVDLGTTASGTYAVSAGPIAIDGAHPEYTIGQDWAQLAPGTEHRWRLRFVDDATGLTTFGEPRTFKTTGTAPSTPTTPPAPTPTTPSTPGTPTAPSEPATPATPAAPATPSETPAGGGAASPATTTGAAATPSAGAASAGPTFSLTPGARLRGLAGRGVGVDVLCPAACRANVKLAVDARTARRLGLGRKATTIATGSATGTKAGTVRVTLRAVRTAARRLRTAKSVKATLSVRLAPGQTRTSVVTLKR